MNDFSTGAEFPYTHPMPGAHEHSCQICLEEATHKVEEVTDDQRHPLTSFLCCAHFGQVMGGLAIRLCMRVQS